MIRERTIYMSFWNTLKNGGFGNSGGLKGLGEEIRDRLNVNKSSSTSSSLSRSPLQTGLYITKEEMRTTKRAVENVVDLVSPKTADILKKHNKKREHLEDTVVNFIDANTPISIAKRVLTEDKKLKASDHIYVQRVGYTHHGLYIGNGNVIHYLQSGVEITDLNTFADEAKIHIKHSPKIHSDVEIINRAFSRIGENNYKLFGNNCDNFVNWCRNGHL